MQIRLAGDGQGGRGHLGLVLLLGRLNLGRVGKLGRRRLGQELHLGHLQVAVEADDGRRLQRQRQKVRVREPKPELRKAAHARREGEQVSDAHVRRATREGH